MLPHPYIPIPIHKTTFQIYFDTENHMTTINITPEAVKAEEEKYADEPWNQELRYDAFSFFDGLSFLVLKAERAVCRMYGCEKAGFITRERTVNAGHEPYTALTLTCGHELI